MDWTAAIDKNREALKRILAMLVAMAGLGGQFPFFPQQGGAASRLAPGERHSQSGTPTLPRQLHRAILRLLRPAEAAARRLVIVAARGLVLPPRRPVLPRKKTGRSGKPPQNPRALPLFDRLSPWAVRARHKSRCGVPRISVPGYTQPFAIVLPHPDDPIDATRLARRLKTLAAALDDLPAQAKRFARWRARAMAARPQTPPPPCGEWSGVGVPRRRISRDTSHVPPRSRRIWPLRPGRPPGWRRKPEHEVHEVLDVLHGLAYWVLEAPDTS